MSDVVSRMYDTIRDHRGPMGDKIGDRLERDLTTTMRQVARHHRLVHFWRRGPGESVQPGDRARCGLVAPPDYDARGSDVGNWYPGDIPCQQCTELMGYVP